MEAAHICGRDTCGYAPYKKCDPRCLTMGIMVKHHPECKDYIALLAAQEIKKILRR